MRTLFRVNNHLSEDGWAEVPGIPCPVPGLAWVQQRRAAA